VSSVWPMDYVALSRPAKVLGYYALVSGALTVEGAPGRFRPNMPDPILVAVLGHRTVGRESINK
jgi:hypothetical protein